MAYTSGFTAVTGATYTAAQYNTNTRDNFTAMWVYTTAGDLAYATSSTTLSRLAPPGSLSLLQHNGTLPSYLAKGNAYEFLRVNAAGNAFEFAGSGVAVASHYDATGYTYSTGAWRDAPSSSNTITTTLTSTIVVFGFMTEYGGATYGWCDLKFNIAGTDINNYATMRYYGISAWDTIPIYGILTGVGAGSVTIKIREICSAGSFTVGRLGWIALAIPE